MDESAWISSGADYKKYCLDCIKYMYSGKGNIPFSEFLKERELYSFPNVYEGERYYLASQPLKVGPIVDFSKLQLPGSLMLHALSDRRRVRFELGYFFLSYTDVYGIHHRPSGTINKYLREIIRNTKPYLSYRDCITALLEFIGNKHICFTEERMVVYYPELKGNYESIILHCNFAEE